MEPSSDDKRKEDTEMAFDIRDNSLFKVALFGVSALAAFSLQFVGSKFAEIFSGISIGPFETITGAIAISVSLGHFLGRSAQKGAKNSLIAYSGFALGLAALSWQSLGKSSEFRIIIPVLTGFVAFLHLGGVFQEDTQLDGLFSYFNSLSKLISYGAPSYLALLTAKVYGVPIVVELSIPLYEFLVSIWPF